MQRNSAVKVGALVVAMVVGVPATAIAEAQVPKDQAQVTLSFSPIVKATTPAVVNIYATRVVAERVSPFADDPFFDQLFNNFGSVQPRVQNSLGSGVIVSSDGIVVSNYHVVGQATEIRVALNDRREFDAKVLLGDEESDLAILKLEGAEGLPALGFADSDGVEVGDLVLAIGNPFGVGQTVSSGIVSGLARSTVGTERGYFIQTDAAINPGNSGGALVNMLGQLVGINTAIVTKSGGSNGIGFAIPSNLVQTVVEQAKAGANRFTRPWAGITGQAVDAPLAEALGLARPDGVVLSSIHPDSPFGIAGLVPGDVVLSLDHAPTNTPQEMIFRLAALGVGATVPVEFLHDGEKIEAEITLIPAPETPPRDQRTVDIGPLTGMTVANMNPALAQETGLPADMSGVVVIGVEDFSSRIGLQMGDVLMGINGIEITSTADVVSVARQRVGRWQIDILRQGQRLQLRFRL